MDPETDAGRRRLPRRDYILLPLLAAATVAVMLGGAELASRIAYASHEVDACFAPDAGGDRHFKPNCTSRTKVAEGPWVENAYNACGYRTREPCGPKPAGALRLAIVGSSTAAGYLVPYDESFAQRAARALSAACRRPVESQNTGGQNYLGARVIPRVDEALALDPDALVMVVTVVDMDLADNERKAAAGAAPAAQPNIFAKIKTAVWNARALYMMQYFLLRSDATYLPFYLQVTSTDGFLQRPLPPLWRERLGRLDAELGEMANKAHARHTPFTLIFAPQRASAAMKASGQAWPGFDQRALPEALAAIAAKHRIDFIDATDGFQTGVPVNQYYYTVNGHLNGLGHKLLSDMYIKRVVAPGGPFAACAQAGAR